MTSVTIIIVSCIVFVSAATACGPNEVEKKDINCESDCCPEPKDQPSACPDPCATACTCQFMYRRAANGTCINARDCPAIPCGENEEFVSCPTCSEMCYNASPDGRNCRFVGRVGTTVNCKPACRCIKYYWRNADNDCVPYEECPGKENSTKC